MRILALETSGRGGEVAAIQREELIVSRSLNDGQRTAQSLAPTIQDVLLRARWRPSDVELVAVAGGPGSFTGLRLGVTTAKTFAYAVGAQLLGLDTLAVIAAGAETKSDRLWAVLPAERRQVFAALFQRDGSGPLTRSAASQIIGIDTWLRQLSAGVAVTGPALSGLTAQLPDGVEIVPERFWQPTAESVGRLAAKDFAAGRRDDIWTLAPFYLRPSAAQEQRDRRDAGQPATE